MGHEPQPPKGKKKRKSAAAPSASLFAASDPISSSTPIPTKPEAIELSAEDRRSLRWDGVLSDPVAEARRIELYKAHRRERYAHQSAFVVSTLAGKEPE
jgi:hypothetical protein